MTTTTIALSDDRLQKLQQIATLFQVAPEELVRVSFVDSNRRAAHAVMETCKTSLCHKTKFEDIIVLIMI